jgi:hypothetical protein
MSIVSITGGLHWMMTNVLLYAATPGGRGGGIEKAAAALATALVVTVKHNFGT